MTGNKLAPSSWQEPRSAGPILVASDSVYIEIHATSPEEATANRELTGRTRAEVRPPLLSWAHRTQAIDVQAKVDYFLIRLS